MKRPPSFLSALEGPRALNEFYTFGAAFPFLQMTPKGDGHPVMVIPGFMASDRTTIPLRAFLRLRGYAAHGWSLGTNDGRDLDPRNGLPSERRLVRRLQALKAEYGCPVSLIGWSWGGIYAREMARYCPDNVRIVITLGSPITGDPRANHVWPVFETMTGFRGDEIEPALRHKMQQPPPVPATAIYSRTDGIVAWQCCLEQPTATTENIGILSSHLGLAHNPLALWVIANRLAQPEGEWRHFEWFSLRGAAYSKQ